ncbi:Spy0128 family protein [Gryllotalpicola protaetiae]|uniref:Spy0128 family protein n=1 Tax=Gryllotalpicola protaetiae TaxID=2419771 RepID=UPI0013C49B08|nr:FctA domain-containing protein [Gryllotalpicola protaetiae]
MAAALAVGLLTSGLAALAPAAHAAPVGPAPATKAADPATYREFPGAHTVGNDQLSSDPGRIWTDKTVFDSSTLAGGSGGPDELGVALSALGSTRHVIGEEQVPIDVSMVLDNSYSMLQCVGSTSTCTSASGTTSYTNSRAYAMVQALDVAIGIIADDNPENRIAIVQFGTNSGVLQALGAPVPLSGTSNPTHYVRMTRTQVGNTVTLTITLGNGQTLTAGTVSGSVQSTNIQRGIVTGMNQLANQPSAAVTGENQRVPNVIVFTDGEPTYSAAQPAWWAVAESGLNQGPSSPTTTQYYGNGFLAAMAASFLKKKIASVYNDADPALAVNPRVYTIGLGIQGLSAQGRDLALATLNPRELLGTTGNTMTAGFTNAFNTYRTGGTPSVPVNSGGQSFTVTHPTNPADTPFNPTGADDLRYNDQYFSPVTQDDLIAVFRQIAQQIIDAAPNHPVEIENGQDTTSGYVTFTDPAGEFMQVSSMNSITFCSALPAGGGEGAPTACVPATFTNPTSSVSGAVTTYTFQGTYAANGLSGPTNVANIRINVERSSNLAVGDVVTVQIPAALLPLNDTWVHEDADGDPVSMNVYASEPVHIMYTVAPKPGVTAALADPLSLNTGGSDAGDALVSYMHAHTDADGHVRFYSNDWNSSAKAANEPDVARTSATFVPAAQNDFYRFGSATPIYTDSAGTTPLTVAAWNGLAPSAALSFRTVAYHLIGSSITKEFDVNTTTKAALVAAGLTVDDAVDGEIVAPAGMADYSSRATSLDHEKCLSLSWVGNNPVCSDPARGNVTATDDWARRTTWGDVGAAGPLAVGTGAVAAALGNNGYLSYEVPGRLIISKQTQADAGLNPNPDTLFGFTVTLGNISSGATFPYSVFNASDPTTAVSSGTVGSGGTIQLKAGQLAEILGLPNGATWSVAEPTPPPGYTQTSPAPSSPQSGTIALPQTTPARADFVNTYSPAPTPAVAGPAIEKVLNGRDWSPTDTFEARLCPVNGPETCESLTLTQAAQSGVFAARAFDTPGTFDFTITETRGGTPGITYSAAEYRWRVVVTDNGTGTLAASSTLTQLRNDDGAAGEAGATTATFTNTFDATEVGVRLTADKLITDLTLPAGEQERAPSVAYNFEFRFLGSAQLNAPTAPTFNGQPSAVASNQPGGTSVISPELLFTSGHVGYTYYYSVVEQPGSLGGVTYDDAAFVYRLTVGATGDPAVVQVTQDVCRTTAAALTGASDGGCTAFGDTAVQFMNTYDAAPATAALSGTKVLEGRPWASGDTFSFDLAASGADTQAAVTSGAVILPTQTTVTVGAAQASGASAPFSFDTITFTRQGTFQFRVSEATDPAPAGVTMDEHWMIADVVVTDSDLDGQLEATVTIQGGEAASTFTNRWSAGLVFNGVDLIKTLTGRELRLGEFEFTVVPADAASAEIAGIPTTGATIANGDPTGAPGLSRLLEGIVFSSTDIGSSFVFHISEAGGSLGGVTYDPTQWTVTLTPGLSAAGDELDVVATVTDGTTTTSTSALAGETPQVSFANTYAADPVTATPEFSKTLIGRAWSADEVFTFQLTAVTPGAPLPAQTTVNVTQANAESFGFGAITFTEPGEFSYLVREGIPSDKQGLTFDINQAMATVTVTDDGEGALAAQIVYDGDENFVNYVQPVPPCPGQSDCPEVAGPSVGTGGTLAEPDAPWPWQLVLGGLAAVAAVLSLVLFLRRKRG